MVVVNGYGLKTIEIHCTRHIQYVTFLATLHCLVYEIGCPFVRGIHNIVSLTFFEIFAGILIQELAIWSHGVNS